MCGMSHHDNRDRYDRVHRSDPHHDVGDSMPGTVGDSEGTLHDRLGEIPSVEEDVEVYEPGQQARQDERESTSDEDVSVEKLVERL